MSAIIREIFWQEYDTTTEIRTVRADIICDAIADLPSGGIMTDYKLDIGSRAKVIADGSEWEIQSTGSWVRQPSRMHLDLTGYATTQDLIDGLAGKVDSATYTAGQAAQDAEISVIAASGAKNMLADKHAAGSVTETNGFRFTTQADGGIKIDSIGTHNANGDYYVLGNWGSTQTLLDLSGDTYTASFSCNTTVSQISIRIFGAGNTAIINNLYLNTERNLTGEVKFIFITVVSTAVIPDGGIVVYPMVRNAAITDSTYAPYAPTNRELYEMIKSYHS